MESEEAQSISFLWSIPACMQARCLIGRFISRFFFIFLSLSLQPAPHPVCSSRSYQSLLLVIPKDINVPFCLKFNASATISDVDQEYTYAPCTWTFFVHHFCNLLSGLPLGPLRTPSPSEAQCWNDARRQLQSRSALIHKSLLLIYDPDLKPAAQLSTQKPSNIHTRTWGSIVTNLNFVLNAQTDEAWYTVQSGPFARGKIDRSSIQRTCAKLEHRGGKGCACKMPLTAKKTWNLCQTTLL